MFVGRDEIRAGIEWGQSLWEFLPFSGRASGPSWDAVPSARSPTIVTRSACRPLTIRTIRSVWARPSSGPRWMSLTTAIRRPARRGFTLERVTGTRLISGSPSAEDMP